MLDEISPTLLKSVDLLIPNETEFERMMVKWPQFQIDGGTAARLEDMAHDKLHVLCRRLGVPSVIITQGERGCFVSTRERWRHLPAFKVSKVVDTTGAGDAFVGNLAAGLVKFNNNLDKSIEYASAAAALSVMKPGTSASMPKRAEVERFLAEAKR
jgi:ribokinase